jgi:hypothetical protein
MEQLLELQIETLSLISVEGVISLNEFRYNPKVGDTVKIIDIREAKQVS